jgi:hypothetical protein
MARIKSRTIDRNRFCKKYPFVKGRKRLTFQGDKDMSIEVMSVSFSNEHEKTVAFEVSFPDGSYRIALSPRDNTASDSANVVLSVEDNISNKDQIKILASAPFTGIVDVIAIRVSS